MVALKSKPKKGTQSMQKAGRQNVTDNTWLHERNYMQIHRRIGNSYSASRLGRFDIPKLSANLASDEWNACHARSTSPIIRRYASFPVSVSVFACAQLEISRQRWLRFILAFVHACVCLMRSRVCYYTYVYCISMYR